MNKFRGFFGVGFQKNYQNHRSDSQIHYYFQKQPKNKNGYSQTVEKDFHYLVFEKINNTSKYV